MFICSFLLKIRYICYDIYIYPSCVDGVMLGGPMLCMGGRSPTFRSYFSYIYISIIVLMGSVGGPHALHGGAKPYPYTQGGDFSRDEKDK